MLACEKSTSPGAIYYLPEATMPWLFPALEICGLALQAMAFFRGSRTLLLCGMAMVLAGAFAERDLSLFAGDLVTSFCGWLFIGRKA